MMQKKCAVFFGVVCAILFAAQPSLVNARTTAAREKQSDAGAASRNSDGKKSGQEKSSDRESDKNDQSEKTEKSSSGGSDNRASGNRNIDPRSFDQELMSKLVFDLTNAERRKAGLSQLDNNRYLAAAATQHSRDMAVREYFAHKSKGIFSRTDPSERISSTGYNPRMTAENIAMIPTYNRQVIQSYPGYGSRVIDADFNTYTRLADYAVREWMASPGHRRNILNGQLTELGVGTAIGHKGNVPYVYLTQDFGG